MRNGEITRGRFPDFLILGAAKSGTTALWRALASHPGVFMSAVKEPGFFAYCNERPGFRCPGSKDVLDTLVFREEEYKALFARCPRTSIAGEASPIYLAHPQAPANAARHVPGAKLVCILRDPAERAFSHWVYYRQKGIEKFGCFEEALAHEPDRLRKGWRLGWGYRELGRYGQHLDRWLTFFPRESLLVIFHEDLCAQPEQTMGRILSHIGVSGGGDLHVPTSNPSFAPRSGRLQSVIMGDNPFRRFARRRLPLWARDAIMWPMLKLNLRRKPALDPAVKARLSEGFEAEIRRVEEITGRDLASWK